MKKIVYSCAFVFCLLSLLIPQVSVFAQRGDSRNSSASTSSSSNETQNPQTTESTETHITTTTSSNTTEDTESGPSLTEAQANDPVVEEKRASFDARTSADADTDSDGDGITDYDEINIYGTNPNDAHTAGGSLSDGEKVQVGIDPTTLNTPIIYEDPRSLADDARVSDKVSVSAITVVEKGVNAQSGQTEAKAIEFSGHAQANAYVTLYIFSMPVVVTVKTDGNGVWSYTLDKELPDGSHEVNVASVDNSGKIVARSNATPFEKQAAAVQVTAPGAAVVNGDGAVTNSYFTPQILTLVFLILLAIIAIAVLIVGLSNKSNPDDIEGGNDKN